MSERFSGDLGKLDRALVRGPRFPRLKLLPDGDPARSFHFTLATHSNYFATAGGIATAGGMAQLRLLSRLLHVPSQGVRNRSGQ